MTHPISNGRLDSTAALLRAPYTFVSSEAKRLGSDMFATRLMMGRATCMRGAAAAELFYRDGLFMRQGAMPGPVARVLFGPGGAQQLDGAPHRHRKAMFMAMMDTAALDRLSQEARQVLEAEAAQWRAEGGVELYTAASEVLMRAVCSWAGVPLAPGEVSGRTRELRALFETPAKLGPAHLRGRRARRAADEWARGVIRGVRAGRIAAPEGAPVRLVAEWTGDDGAPLSENVAAVELLNVLRPTVAVSVYVAFLAHALHAHGGMAERVAADTAFRHAFVQEVRRDYPFFPLLAAKATRDIAWEGLEIPAGRLVVLDLYGTDHHPAAWTEPEAFRPERFLDWPGDPFTMVPQGGGDHATGHRCPGEWITIRMMELFAEVLAAEPLLVPAADISPDMAAVPALPRRGVPLKAA